MKHKTVYWKWEDPDAQKSFVQWQGFPDQQVTKEEVDNIIALTGITDLSLKILDLGCGTGRHSIEFANRGYNVVGIDVAETYLSEAKSKAKELNLNINFRLQRGSDLKEKEVFDFILAYYHTLGFMSCGELDLHFRNIYDALNSKGLFFLRTAGPQFIPGRDFKNIKNWAENNNKFILSEKYFDNGYRVEKCIEIDTINDEIIEYIEKQKAFSFEEVKNILKKSGFKKLKCYKDLSGKAANPQEFGIYVSFK